jgi:hypothetical protein
MEVWGDAILKAGGRDWLGIKGGKRAVVEAVVVRDLCAPVSRCSTARRSTE